MESKRLFGLIGKTLSHSFSKEYFTDKFSKENINDCEFNLYPIENINELPQLILKNPTLEGLSVTIPYKESVINYLDELDETAKKIGAVNCIKIIHLAGNKTRLVGYNTDVFGFRQSIKPFLASEHQRALILGTGGASKAAAYVLKEIGIDCVFVTRDKKENAKSIGSNHLINYREIDELIINAFKLIVNTTPVGMFPNVNDAPNLPYQYITSSHLIYDLVYNPIETEFLKRGKSMGATTINGLSMLHQQAEEAWRIWNNVELGIRN